jgi:hypothetical protein
MAPYGAPCNYINSCNEGLMCVNAEGVPEPECTSEAGCCSPYCNLNDGNTCPGVDQECQPVFDPQPSELEHVGVCLVPQ